jgi:hypothetical protein
VRDTSAGKSFKLVTIITFIRHALVARNAVILLAMEKKCICKARLFGILDADPAHRKMERQFSMAGQLATLIE